MLENIGIKPIDDPYTSRKLVFETNRDDIQLLLLRGVDVATYVRFGSADVGVMGKDLLMETDCSDFYEPVDLGIARCRLMTARPKGTQPKNGRLRVATKYIQSASEYYASQGRQVDLIKLYGAMELAPIMGLADEIVDIVDTGNTLKANGLEACETICDISSRLIVNRTSYKAKHNEIVALISALEEALGVAS